MNLEKLQKDFYFCKHTGPNGDVPAHISFHRSFEDFDSLIFVKEVTAAFKMGISLYTLGRLIHAGVIEGHIFIKSCLRGMWFYYFIKREDVKSFVDFINQKQIGFYFCKHLNRKVLPCIK